MKLLTTLCIVVTTSLVYAGNCDLVPITGEYVTVTNGAYGNYSHVKRRIVAVLNMHSGKIRMLRSAKEAKASLYAGTYFENTDLRNRAKSVGRCINGLSFSISHYDERMGNTEKFETNVILMLECETESKVLSFRQGKGHCRK